MKLTLKRLALLTAGAGLLTIYGCGGGGGDSPAANSGGNTSPITLSGPAATGAAFTDAIITVKDKTGAVVGTSAKVGADGLYSVTLSAGAAAPFILIASRTSADGATESLVSVVPSVTGSSATVNITPVTNLIASRLATTSGDPLKLADEVVANPTLVSTTTVTSKVQEVQTILAPILAATATTGTDPLSGSFAVNGTGYDRLLDTIKVTITPESNTTTNIEIGVKLATGAETAPPPVIQFTSSQPVATITSTNNITAAAVGSTTISNSDLIASGTASLIADHLAQLQSCYALPLSSRIAANGTTAADITASECKNAFVSSNPSLFKSNGRIVGKGKAFNGMFVEGGTGVVFSQGTYEFTRSNGDIVVGYKSRTTAGNELFDTFVLRKDTDGKLKQIGNQYNYPGGVSAYHQVRQFITLSQSPFNYHSTGYVTSVDDVIVNGASIFDRVVVTTPNGAVLTLKPSSGSSFLPLVKGNTTSGTNFVRLSREYVDTANTADPALKDTRLFFSDSKFTNAQISALPEQSVWKFDYYLASDPTAIAATQTYKTRSRALTIPELKQKGLAQLLPAAITEIGSKANSTTGVIPVGGEPSLQPPYSVPTGALPPTTIIAFGSYNSGNSSFNDSVTVGSTARTANILCSPTGVTGDQHCTTTATGSTLFAPSAVITGLSLVAKDPTGREFASFYAMYKLN